MRRIMICFAVAAMLSMIYTITGRASILKQDICETSMDLMVKMPEEEELLVISDNDFLMFEEVQGDKTGSLIHPEGMTLEKRILPPQEFCRVGKELRSFQGYLRQYQMKQDQSRVLLYDGSPKGNQDAQAAVFAMPVFNSDLQQCADSIMRMYGEYLWSVRAHEQIAFHLTNGFLMDYPTWQSGKRLLVDGNQVSWVKKASYDDSHDTFLNYMQYVMMYAGTLSLEKESVPIEIGQIQAGDMFVKGGSPGHCVMVADVAENESGERCFLLAQGYMPAQDFHIIKNPLHEDDPWYYTSELTYPLYTPEYVFGEGSLKRWYGFVCE